MSISEGNPVNFTRKYTERDQLTSSSLGGIGAEGSVPIPEGVVFRIRKGAYLAIQAHYLNPTQQGARGETYIDVKMTPRNDANTVAGHFGNTSLQISLPPGVQTAMDINCEVKEDLHILRMTNHMHYQGVSAYTEYTDPSGKTTMLKEDKAWESDWALTPNYDNFPVSAPLVLPAGSTIHTHCLWANDTARELKFPEEMCVFATVILGEREIACIDGAFTVRNLEDSEPGSVNMPAADAGTPAGDGAGDPAPVMGDGACTGAADQAVLATTEFEDSQRTCARMCLGSDEACATSCLAANTTLTAECAGCNGAQLTCAMEHCIVDCISGFMSDTCRPCLDTNCGDYHTCSGL